MLCTYHWSMVLLWFLSARWPHFCCPSVERTSLSAITLINIIVFAFLIFSAIAKFEIKKSVNMSTKRKNPTKKDARNQEKLNMTKRTSLANMIQTLMTPKPARMSMVKMLSKMILPMSLVSRNYRHLRWNYFYFYHILF